MTYSTALQINHLIPDADASLAGQTFTGITQDSRKVSPGDIFVALNGTRVSGVKFIDDALAAGAAAVLADKSAFDRQIHHERVLWVDKLDKKLSHFAGQVYGDPEQRTGHRRHNRHQR